MKLKFKDAQMLTEKLVEKLGGTDIIKLSMHGVSISIGELDSSTNIVCATADNTKSFNIEKEKNVYPIYTFRFDKSTVMYKTNSALKNVIDTSISDKVNDIIASMLDAVLSVTKSTAKYGLMLGHTFTVDKSIGGNLMVLPSTEEHLVVIDKFKVLNINVVPISDEELEQIKPKNEAARLVAIAVSGIADEEPRVFNRQYELCDLSYDIMGTNKKLMSKLNKSTEFNRDKNGAIQINSVEELEKLISLLKTE